MTTNIKGYVVTDWLQKETGDPLNPYVSLYRVRPYNNFNKIVEGQEVYIGFNPPNGEMVTVNDPFEQGFRVAQTAHHTGGFESQQVFSNTKYGVSTNELQNAILNDLHQQQERGNLVAQEAYKAMYYLDQTGPVAFHQSVSQKLSTVPQAKGFLSKDGKYSFIAVPKEGADANAAPGDFIYFKIDQATGEAKKVWNHGDGVTEIDGISVQSGFSAEGVINGLTPDNWNSSINFRNRSSVALAGILDDLKGPTGYSYEHNLVSKTIRIREFGSQGNQLLNRTDLEELKRSGGITAGMNGSPKIGDNLREAGTHALKAAGEVLDPTLQFLSGPKSGSIKLLGGLIIGALGAKTMGLEAKGLSFWAVTFLGALGVSALGNWLSETANKAKEQASVQGSELNQMVDSISNVFNANGGAKQVAQPQYILNAR